MGVWVESALDETRRFLKTRLILYEFQTSDHSIIILELWKFSKWVRAYGTSDSTRTLFFQPLENLVSESSYMWGLIILGLCSI